MDGVLPPLLGPCPAHPMFPALHRALDTQQVLSYIWRMNAGTVTLERDLRAMQSDPLLGG